MFFCLHTLLLVLVPAVASELGAPGQVAGLILVAYTGLGLVTDLPAARAADVVGARTIILAGTGGLLLGCALLAAATSTAVLLVAAVVLGLATSCMFSPILGGLASAAGERQHATQAVNVAVQRAGALLAALYIGQAGLADGARAGAAGAAVLVLVLAVIATRLPGRLSRPGPPRAPGAREAADPEPIPPAGARAAPGPGVYRAAVRLVRRSREAGAGLVVSGVVPMLMIFGGSFFPLLLIADDQSGLVAPALIAREIVAVATAGLLGTRLRAVPLRPLALGSLALSAASFAALAGVHQPALTCAVFAVHGTALGVGVMASNIHLYRGTDDSTRLSGFATGGMIARLVGIGLPVAFGAALDVSRTTLLLVAAGTTVGFGVLYAMLQRDTASRSRRGTPPPGPALSLP